MLHLLYILAFTIIAFLAIANLIRSLITLSVDTQRFYPPTGKSYGRDRRRYGSNSVPHPELLDDRGQPVNEPLLVMRSVTVEDARKQLDAIYNASPSQPKETTED